MEYLLVSENIQSLSAKIRFREQMTVVLPKVSRVKLLNAIERAAKNIRGSEMICMSQNTFPYVIFASGCDFHNTETIASRLEMMNMAFKPLLWR